MIKYQTKRIIGNAFEKVTASFSTLSTTKRVVGIVCSNENTRDYGRVQLGLNVGGAEILPDDFPMILLTSESNKYNRRAKAGLKRYFDLTPFAIKAGGQTVNISLKGNKEYAVDVILILDDIEVTDQQSRKYQIIRVIHSFNSTVKKSFTTPTDYKKVTGISLIYYQPLGEFFYKGFSRLGLKVSGSDVLPIEYPASNLLVNSRCVQMDENFYDLKPFDVSAGGTTAEITYTHNVPSNCIDPDLICVFEFSK